MKASLKLRDEKQSPLLKAKVPITVLGLPFISSVCAGDPSDLSFHIITASSGGPSLKLSYRPNDSPNPFSFSVKSGIGLCGSPLNSPLVMSAHFSLLGSLNPSFSLLISPNFGDFSLKKSASSLNPNANANSNPNRNFNVPIKENCGTHVGDPQPPVQSWWAEENHQYRTGFFSDAALTARTGLPVTKRIRASVRWRVNFPAEIGRKNLPYLTVDKIGIERVNEVVKAAKQPGEGSDRGVGDLEVLKGMCFYMGREVEALQRENRSMKETLEELRLGIVQKSRREVEIPAIKKKVPEMKGDSSEFERWRKKKQNEGGDDGRRETKNGGSPSASGNDIGEELKRAIMAAAS